MRELIGKIVKRPMMVIWICFHDEAFWTGFLGLIVTLIFMLIHHLEWLEIFDDMTVYWGAFWVFVAWATIACIWNSFLPRRKWRAIPARAASRRGSGNSNSDCGIRTDARFTNRQTSLRIRRLLPAL